MKNKWRDFKTDPPPERKRGFVILVWLEEPFLHSQLRVAIWSSGIKTIASNFDFDCPKILKWRHVDDLVPKEE